MDALALALLLAAANKALLDYIAAPIHRRFPSTDLWWFDYLALVSGAALAWFAQADLFGGLIMPSLVGRILTALLVGGGTAMLNQLFGGGPVGARAAGSGRRVRGW